MFMRIQVLATLLLIASECFAATPSSQPAPAIIHGRGKLGYTTAPSGDRVPDFSYAGYHGGNDAILDVPIKVIVPATTGDATARIQAAIDQVAALPEQNGIRGAVLLESGRYEV